jgi:hypothetical protein
MSGPTVTSMSGLGADLRTPDAPRGWNRLASRTSHFFTDRADLLAACHIRMMAPELADPDDAVEERCERCLEWVRNQRSAEPRILRIFRARVKAGSEAEWNWSERHAGAGAHDFGCAGAMVAAVRGVVHAAGHTQRRHQGLK